MVVKDPTPADLQGEPQDITRGPDPTIVADAQRKRRSCYKKYLHPWFWYWVAWMAGWTAHGVTTHLGWWSS